MTLAAARRLIVTINQLVIFDHLYDGADATVFMFARPAGEEDMCRGKAGWAKDASLEVSEVPPYSRNGEEQQLADTIDGVSELAEREDL